MHQITKSKNLNDLNGVTLTTPANGEVLTYDSTAQEWVNQAVPTPTVPSNLDDLSDVSITTPTAGDYLTFDDLNQEWINHSISLSDLSDTTLPTPIQQGAVLTYDALNQWTHSLLGIDNLADVDLSNPADGQVIKYDATLGKWVNATGGGGASYKILTDTLEAGHTSITFTDADILADSIVSCATPAGINPTAMTSTTGSVTFYFQSQAADMVVKAVIF